MYKRQLHHRFIEGTTTLSEVGSYVEAGLPNIQGSQGSLYPGSLEPVETGVLKFWRNANFKLTGLVATDSGAPVGVSLNASWGDSVYGASDTVQPNTIRGQFLIRYE